MRVTSKAGTELDVDMVGASTVGVWGWTDKPGTLAHWPGGIVVSFPRSGTVNGTLVMAAGDLTTTGNLSIGGTLTGTDNSNNQARTVNTLPLEQYVADTVPGESPSSFAT